jgi:tripartite-type tricarboxylate transporter receptor subunit TctC
MKAMKFPYWFVPAAVALLALPFAAMAQTYPTRPITLVVPYAAGGGTDNVARALAKGMSEKLGQAVVIDNRGGGGGVIGSNLVAKADPDGYTLLFVSSSFVTHVATEEKPSYDVLKDYSPVAMFGSAPLILVSHKSVGAKTVPELVAVTGSARSPLFPQVPTIAESGVPNYNITTWWGVLAPANTPAPIAYYVAHGNGDDVACPAQETGRSICRVGLMQV